MNNTAQELKSMSTPLIQSDHRLRKRPTDATSQNLLHLRLLLGGDQQIGAKIVEGQIDFMIFLWDPLEAQPHDPDVKALLRIAVVYDIPVANNLATADFMLNSKFMNEPYSRQIENFNKTIQDRVAEMK